MDIDDLEARARELLTEQAYDYYAGGADDELTLTENERSWERLRLRPHVLRDVSDVQTATTVLGVEVASPVLVAPMASQRMAHDEGEAATARGAAAAGTLMIVSTIATVSLEDVAAAAPSAPRWFQLYLRRDRGWGAELVRRADAAGYRAIVLTVDLPVLGHRRRDERHPDGLPDGLHLANMPDASEAGQWLAAAARDDLDPALTPDDIGWICSLTDLPVIVKGVLRGDDAAECVEAGAAGVIVSNHGGRQLDTAIAGAQALPEVAEAVGDRAEVYVDGGVRRGTDVVKALSLGARAVLVGRPLLWALTVGGADGVRDLLLHLQAETERAMALCGARVVAECTPDLIAPPR
jgi:4-hydroxymandelate oxidase